MKLEEIRKINKNIVHEDGSIDSFAKQLLYLEDGRFNIYYPMVISTSSKSLDYINDIDVNAPLIVNVSTVIKIRHKHNLGFSVFQDLDDMFKNSILAFDSLAHDSSRVILLNKIEDEDLAYKQSNLIAICRYDRQNSQIHINEITSLYSKKNLETFLSRTFNANKQFHKNKKTEQYFKSAGLQLPLEMKYALSDSYTRTSFTKSQVVQDIQKNKIHFGKDNKLSVAERATKAKGIMEQRQRKKSVNNHDLKR